LIGDAPRSFEAAARSTDGYVAANASSAIITNVPLIEIAAAMTATIPMCRLRAKIPRMACERGFNQTEQGLAPRPGQAKGPRPAHSMQRSTEENLPIWFDFGSR
jgi:hypothetical protein